MANPFEKYQVPWVENLRQHRKKDIVNKDLYVACANATLVGFQSGEDPDRTYEDLVRIGKLLEPERQIISWTSAQPATNVETGRPIPILQIQERISRFPDPETGQNRERAERHVTRNPVTTTEELFHLIADHPNPAIFFLPNSHLAFESSPSERRALIDLYQTLNRQLREQNKSVILQTPPGTELPTEIIQMLMAVSESPVTREERQVLLQRMIADTGLRGDPRALQQSLDALTGLNRTQSDLALRAALTRKYAIDGQLPKNILNFKREQVAAHNLWEVMDTENVPELVGWDRFEREIEQNIDYGTFDLNSPHNVQMYFLVGQAGTGKTTMARKVAQMLNRPGYLAVVSSWMGSLMGQTEQRMRAAVNMIYAAQPAVGVLDEAQRVLQSNDQRTGGGTMNRSVQSLLTRMEEGRQNGEQVLWVMTANEVDNLPPELLRRGRTWAVHFPGPETRKAIFNSKFEKFSTGDHRMRRDRNLTDDQIAELTRGYGGGDIEQLLSRAAVVGQGLVSADSIKEASQFITRQENLTPQVIARRREELSRFPSVSSDIEEDLESLEATRTSKKFPSISIPTPKSKLRFQPGENKPDQSDDDPNNITISID